MTPSQLVRRVVWLGHVEADIAGELTAGGWQVIPLSSDDGAEAAIGRSGACVAVVDLGDGDDARLMRVEALIAAQHELQWLAVVPAHALLLPGVCELIHDQCFDFLARPLDAPGVAMALGHAWGKAQLRLTARRALPNRDSDLGLVGASPVLDGVRERLRKFAGFDMPVLLTGETGTGKDVAARALHARSTRCQGPFVAINCGALPENLVQSELFGHERGAFTGANARRIGRIEAAEDGVVLLDEIGDLPLEAQCNLLRFLEEQTIERVGSTRSIRVNTRVIAATHVDLQRAVGEGRFREDLYYRLNVLHVHLPALRERQGDAEILARHFLEQFRRRHGERVRGFSAAALKAIAAHPWPGNVREVVNRVHGAAVTSDKRLIGADDLGLAAARDTGPDLQTARAQSDRDTIADHLRVNGYNMSECARRLNISRVTLYRLCKKYGLKTEAVMLATMLYGMFETAGTGDGPAWVASSLECARYAARALLA